MKEEEILEKIRLDGRSKDFAGAERTAIYLSSQESAREELEKRVDKLEGVVVRYIMDKHEKYGEDKLYIPSPSIDSPKCVCGKQICLGGAEVEIGGVCHRPNNPCYVIEDALEVLEDDKPDTFEQYWEEEFNKHFKGAEYSPVKIFISQLLKEHGEKKYKEGYDVAWNEEH